MKVERLTENKRYLGLIIKRPHTIVEEWPIKLKLRPEQVGTKKKFKILFAFFYSGAKRYME